MGSAGIARQRCPCRHLLVAVLLPALGGWGILLAGCVSLADVPTAHIIMINGRGNPVAPDSIDSLDCRDGAKSCAIQQYWFKVYPTIERGQYEQYLGRMFAALQDTTCAKKGDDRRRILIFIHGGLNTQAGTVERAAELQERICNEGYYPIFINWQSSLFSSYFDHLINVRQGESWDTWGWILTPFYFASDIARAVARAPIVWYFELRNDAESHKWITTKEQAEVNHIAAELAREYDRQSSEHRFAIAFAHDKDYAPVDPPANWEQALAATTGVLTVPFKAVTSMFIDAFGKSAWDIMLRRTQMLFHTEREFLRSDLVAADYLRHNNRTSHIKADGGLSVFLRRLQETVEKKVVDNAGNPLTWDITLVGHSMGTIVLNQIIRDFGDLPISSIVYMAAATTVRDYEDTLFPFLQTHADARMYHLTLHQRAEVRERFDTPIPFTDRVVPYVDFPPRGSLLVWIDDFLSSPETRHDRTVGRFDNLILTAHDAPDNLRDRISIKAFGAGNDVKAPQKHSDFTSGFRFWKRECWWSPGPEPAPGCYSP